MNALLTDMTPGFRDPAHAAQRTYRVLLDVMARPGLVRRLPMDTLEGLMPPPPIAPGAAAVMLSLLDAETHIALHGANDTPAVESFLRFHTGARVTRIIEDAEFALGTGHALSSAFWSRLAIGTDEMPQLGATMIVEVAALGSEHADESATRLLLRGPGIETEANLIVAGPPRAFWEWRIALQDDRPRGVDLILTCGDRLAALPRSTHLQPMDGGR
jgi:alpha-D-ribose 1-methylphosphonate 5-triphosphate synthase subunit PhnH